MRTAIIYYSETGCTRELAEQMYVTLPAGSAEIYDVSKISEPPAADMYYIGFPVHNMCCPLAVTDIIEMIHNADIALFCTCGLDPTEKYKNMIEKRTTEWINDSCRYSGIFLCQGRTTSDTRSAFLKKFSVNSETIEYMLDKGNSHPDDDDFDAVSEFCEMRFKHTYLNEALI